MPPSRQGPAVGRGEREQAIIGERHEGARRLDHRLAAVMLVARNGRIVYFESVGQLDPASGNFLAIE
jgi:hypothetical protein